MFLRDAFRISELKTKFSILAAISLVSISSIAVVFNTQMSSLAPHEFGLVIVAIAALVFTLVATVYVAKGIVDLMRAFSSAVVDVTSGSAGSVENGFRLPIDSKVNCALGQTFGTMVNSVQDYTVRLQMLAYQDVVTGLPNRTALNEYLAAKNNVPAAIMQIDLHNFSDVNHAFGHVVGDALLKKVALRLSRASLDDNSVDIRIGSFEHMAQGVQMGRVLFRTVADEFVIAIQSNMQKAELEAFATKLLDQFTVPFILSGSEIKIGASVGIVEISSDDYNPEVIIEHARIAKNHAKTLGGSTFAMLNDDLKIKAARRAELERNFKSALDNDEIIVHFQPKITTATQAIMGVEALVRWQHPTLGLLYPADFLSIAEANGLMVELGRKVFELAAQQIRTWQAEGFYPSVSVNVCPTEFLNERFADDIIIRARQIGVPASQIILEITETVAMTNAGAAKRHLAKLKAAGFKVAIDDFGVGYSNLAQLYKLDYDYIKIDRSLIENIDFDGQARQIVEFSIGIAHSMGKKVIAEGIETLAQLNQLKAMDCDYAQGYLFGRPVAPEAIFASHGRIAA